VRHLGGDDSVMMGEGQVMDETERERGKQKESRGRAIVLFLTPPQKTPWQAVNQMDLLD